MSASCILQPTIISPMTVDLNKDVLHEAGIGNFFRPSQLEQLGITYHRLRQLEAAAAVERVGWGLYRLADAEPTERYSIACGLRQSSPCNSLPAIGASGARDRHPTPTPSMDRHPAQGETSPTSRNRCSPRPVQWRGFELWRGGNKVRGGACSHHFAGAHDSRLFQVRAIDRTRGGT